ncbi:MAG: hypothetical protein U1E53_13120 [Dongiaceae bacterium]
MSDLPEWVIASARSLWDLRWLWIALVIGLAIQWAVMSRQPRR